MLLSSGPLHTGSIGLTFRHTSFVASAKTFLIADISDYESDNFLRSVLSNSWMISALRTNAHCPLRALTERVEQTPYVRKAATKILVSKTAFTILL